MKEIGNVNVVGIFTIGCPRCCTQNVAQVKSDGTMSFTCSKCGSVSVSKLVGRRRMRIELILPKCESLQTLLAKRTS